MRRSTPRDLTCFASPTSRWPAARSGCSTARSLTVHAGHKVGLVGAERLRQVEPVRADPRRAARRTPGAIDLPPSWTIAHVAQETPPSRRRRSTTSLDGDRELRDDRARARRPRPPPPTIRRRRRGARGAAPPLRGRSAATRRAPARRRCSPGLGFPPRSHARSGGELLRRLADAAQSRAGADVPLGPAAARRADQPPRPRRRAVARGLARALSGHAAAHHARPRFPRRASSTRIVHFDARKLDVVHRQLRAVRARARAAARAAAGDLREAAAADRASAGVRRPLPRQGDEGEAGAKPDQGARADGADRRGARRQPVRVRVPASRPRPRQLVQLEHVDAGLRRTRRRCSRDVDWGILAGDAHRAARPQRRRQVDAAESDRRHARAAHRRTRSPRRRCRIGYFAQHQVEQLRAERIAAVASAQDRARRRASRSCATSSAASTSAATWRAIRSAASPAARRRG